MGFVVEVMEVTLVLSLVKRMGSEVKCHGINSSFVSRKENIIWRQEVKKVTFSGNHL